MRGVQGIEDLGVFHVLGQPNLNITVDRPAAARYQINVADVEDAIQTAVGANALTQVLEGEARYDLVLRYLPQYRDTLQAGSQTFVSCPPVENASPWPSSRRFRCPMAVQRFIAKATSAMSPSSTAFVAAISVARSKRPSTK